MKQRAVLRGCNGAKHKEQVEYEGLDLQVTFEGTDELNVLVAKVEHYRTSSTFWNEAQKLWLSMGAAFFDS